jgi:SRSO17 transposase
LWQKQGYGNEKKTANLSEWGLSLEVIAGLGKRLAGFYERYRVYLRTKTRDTSDYGLHYVSGLLRMESQRTMANIGRTSGIAEQNMQQFISDSPWSGPRLIAGVQAEISARAEYQSGSVLILDESADAKSGETTVGAGRQHNGRLGKVDVCQVGVFLALTNNGYQTWIDGELFVPEHWFGDEFAAKRQRLGVPAERVFATKLELAVQLVQRAQERGIPFEAVDCDTLYGRKGWLRDQLHQLGIEYYADIPQNTRVYLEKPLVYFPPSKPGKRAKPPQITGIASLAKELVDHSQTEWHTLVLRPSERGLLQADFARRRIWTVDTDGTLRQEWLLIRRDSTQLTYSLSNAPTTTPLLTMAQRKAQRYLIERANQDAKSELGWDEVQAIKYRAWQHHLALTILASWFITETKLDWAQQFVRDPHLLEYYEVEVLPDLSVANVRTLLRAAMPLPHLSPQEAAALVVKHLDNRTRSRKSRLRTALSP